MHGVGIASLSYAMDSIVESSTHNNGEPDVETFIRGLKSIKPVCRWSSGTWEFGNGVTREWNEIQNTTKDPQLLTSYLLFELRRRSNN